MLGFLTFYPFSLRPLSQYPLRSWALNGHQHFAFNYVRRVQTRHCIKLSMRLERRIVFVDQIFISIYYRSLYHHTSRYGLLEPVVDYV